MPRVKLLKDAQVCGDVISGHIRLPVEEQFFVKYGDRQVKMGDQLTPEDTSACPQVDFVGLPDKKTSYLVIMTDPDVPSRAEPKFRELLHWIQQYTLSEELEGALVSKTILPYIGPAPPQGSGLHRYVFLLYKGPADEIEEEKSEIGQRMNLSAAGYAKRMGFELQDAIYFQAEKEVRKPVK